MGFKIIHNTNFHGLLIQTEELAKTGAGYSTYSYYGLLVKFTQCFVAEVMFKWTRGGEGE